MSASRPAWRGVIYLMLLLVLAVVPFATSAGAQTGGLKASSATGSLQLSLYDCPPGTDAETDVADCLPTESPWNLWIAPQDAQQLGDERWLVDDAVETDKGVYRFDDLAPGSWDFSPDQDGPDGPVAVVVTGDPTTRPGLWQVEIVAGAEAVASVYRTLPEGYADTGTVSLHLMTCAAGADPLTDDSACDTASEPWGVALELVGQSDVQTWTLADHAVTQPDGSWQFAGLPAATLTIDSAIPVDETDVIVGGDAYLLGNMPVIDVVGGETVTVILYQVPIA